MLTEQVKIMNIMKLTEKAKEDFEKHVENLPVAPYVSMLDSIPTTYLNALIIEWFDKKGFTIDRNSYGRTMVITDWTDGNENRYVIDCEYLEPFEEWWDAAIEKTNTLYNETK